MSGVQYVVVDDLSISDIAACRYRIDAEDLVDKYRINSLRPEMYYIEERPLTLE